MTRLMKLCYLWSHWFPSISISFWKSFPRSTWWFLTTRQLNIRGCSICQINVILQKCCSWCQHCYQTLFAWNWRTVQAFAAPWLRILMIVEHVLSLLWTVRFPLQFVQQPYCYQCINIFLKIGQSNKSISIHIRLYRRKALRDYSPR